MKKRITIIFLSITIIIAQISSPVFASNLINKNQLLNNMATDWIKLLEEIEDTYYGKILNDTIETVIISDESIGTVEEVTCKKGVSPDTIEDKKLYKENNEEYSYRIAPFVDNYVVEDVNANEKGSTVLLAVVTIVLFVTIAVILAAIYAVSKVQM